MARSPGKAGELLTLFLLPGLIFLAVVRIAPLLYTIYLSFFSWNLVRGGGIRFIGLDNYLTILTDVTFIHSFFITIVYTGGVVVVELVFGLALALLVNGLRSQITRGAMNTLISMPLILTPVVVGTLWRLIYHNEYGLLNYLLGLEGVTWLASRRLALPAVMLVDVWQWTSFVFLILFAALQNLPQEAVEAAAIDGASAVQVLRYITLPFLAPFISVAVILRSIDAFKVFDTVFTLTGGGPGRATDVLTMYVYKYAFAHYEVGYAAAAVSILLAILMFMGFGLYQMLERKR